MEAERSDVQGHLCLHSKHKADLDYMTAHLEKDSGAPQPRTKSSHRFLSADFALGPEVGLHTQFVLRAIRASTPSPEKTKPKRGRYLPLVSTPNNVPTLDPFVAQDNFLRKLMCRISPHSEQAVWGTQFPRKNTSPLYHVPSVWFRDSRQALQSPKSPGP